jgi:hypothetical protein
MRPCGERQVQTPCVPILESCVCSSGLACYVCCSFSTHRCSPWLGCSFCGMVSALFQLSPGLCEAGEGSSRAVETALRRPRGLARSAVRRKFVLDAGLDAVVPSIDAPIFVGNIALHLRGGRARFVNIAPGAPPLQRMRRQRTPRTIV